MRKTSLVLMWAMIVAQVFSAEATTCPEGSIELWREVVGGTLRIHCKEIGRLTEGEIKQLTPVALNRLSKAELESLDRQCRDLGMAPVVILSLLISPEEKAFLQRELADLAVKMNRASEELKKVQANRNLAEQAATLNRQISTDLTMDAIGYALDLTDACLAAGGGKSASPWIGQLKQAVAAAKSSANAVAAAKSEADSARQGLKLGAALLGLKAMVPPSATGMSPEQWEMLNKSLDALPDLVALQERLLSKPLSEFNWDEIKSSLDDMAGMAGEFHALLKGSRAGVHLTVMTWTKWKIAKDRDEIDAAGAVGLSAENYWTRRIEHYNTLASFYRERLERSTGSLQIP